MMMHPSLATAATILIAVISIAGVIMRPWRLREAIWAVLGAIVLVATGLLPIGLGVKAVGKGLDVYLFLIGMMLLSEVAREEGLFDYLAAHAARAARGSPKRLFLLIYATGTIVTTFMSNDATAVVLTPAVFAAAKAAKAKPLPYLYICAFVANAASFVLPISNPANLVLFQSHTPQLLEWLGRFAFPSVCSIVVTYFLLFLLQRRALVGKIERPLDVPRLSATGRMAALGIGLTSICLMTASAFDAQLGWPTFIAAVCTTIIVTITKHQMPWRTIKGISWDVLLLVAGLFVLVEGLDHIGLIKTLADFIAEEMVRAADSTAIASALGIAAVCNLMNNLPAGLIAGMTVANAHASPRFASALLLGVDLGPNLSVTGSLATILWLTALRREGEHVTAWEFLKLGAVLMPAALIPAIAALFAFG